MHLKRILLSAVVAAVFATPAAAVEVKLSGQVNRSIMFADDGVTSDTFHVDNDASSTRFRFVGNGEARPGLKAGVIFEMEYQSAPSNTVDFTDRVTAGPDIDERIMDVFLEGRYGRFTLGQGDGAANGGIEVDLSGTSVIQFSDGPTIGGGIEFRGPGGAAGPELGAVLANQDFESRYDRMRYDTPNFAGFSLAASSGVKNEAAAPISRDVWEVALRYAGDFAGFGKLAGAAGFSHQDGVPGGVDDETTGGSLSWMHASGANLTVGYSTRDRGTRDAAFTYAKLGYKAGRHAVSLDYTQGEDQSALGDEASAVGIAYVYAPNSWLELYGLAKRAQLDQPGVAFDDISIFVVGTRIKF
jgi:hypothetical protein